MKPSELSGRCLCGAVQYRINGKVDDAFFCHCESCRRSSGAPFMAWGRVKQDRFELIRGGLKEFASSPGVTRSRCANCGTEITYQHKDCDPDLDFPLATLDAPEKVTPAYHIRVSEKLPWIVISDKLPTYAEWREKNRD